MLSQKWEELLVALGGVPKQPPRGTLKRKAFEVDEHQWKEASMNLSAANIVSSKVVIDFVCLSLIDDKGEVDPPFLGGEGHGLFTSPSNEGSTISIYKISCEILVNF